MAALQPRRRGGGSLYKLVIDGKARCGWPAAAFNSIPESALFCAAEMDGRDFRREQGSGGASMKSRPSSDDSEASELAA